MQKKLVPVNTDKLYELITLLEADIVKLKTEESYQKHDPQYYDYVVYYEDLAETIFKITSGTDIHLFGTYLVALLAYQVVEKDQPLYRAAEIIVDELKTRYEELTKPETTHKRNSRKKEKDEDDDKKYLA